ncbi:MAG: hypothetical protein WC376_00230 [Candidatus Nanoarchaeia archaeon]|jgi:hypothetical protein
MEENLKNLVINDYLNMPSIKLVLIQVRDLEAILKPNENDISLRHCVNHRYVVKQENRYKITAYGIEALGVIEGYNKTR